MTTPSGLPTGSECAGRWPEQDALDAWWKAHRRELLESVTAYRLKVQAERDKCERALAASPPEAEKEPERDGEPLVERVAKAIYDAMRCGDPEGQRRPWIPGGNSLKQSEAREMARIAIEPTVSAEEERDGK